MKNKLKKILYILFCSAIIVFYFANNYDAANLTVKLLVVGAGGGTFANIGGFADGGGGGGEFTYNAAYAITSAKIFTVTIGQGVNNANGESTYFDAVTAMGGGAGGNTNSVGSTGACGGGGSGPWMGGTGSKGYNGGQGLATQGGGGGGGMGSPGSSPGSEGGGGNGGDGLPNPISGSTAGVNEGGTYYFCGGGAGSGSLSHGNAGKGGGSYYNNGPDNSGGGAGGGAGGGTSPFKGGSGIVIISYITSDFNAYTVAGGDITTSGATTIHTFTTNGTWSVIDKTAPVGTPTDLPPDIVPISS